MEAQRLNTSAEKENTKALIGLTKTLLTDLGTEKEIKKEIENLRTKTPEAGFPFKFKYDFPETNPKAVPSQQELPSFLGPLESFAVSDPAKEAQIKELEKQLELRGSLNNFIKSFNDVQPKEPSLNPFSSFSGLKPDEINFDKTLELLEERKKKINDELTDNKELQTQDRQRYDNLKENLREIEQLEEEIANLKGLQNERIKEQNRLIRQRTTVGGGIETAGNNLRTEIEEFPAQFADRTVISFRDGLRDAMQLAINNTEDLESALLDVANSFAKGIQTALLNNLANQIVTSIPIPAWPQSKRRRYKSSKWNVYFWWKNWR